MADLLALSWDRRKLSGIEFSRHSGHPRVSAGFTVDLPEQPPTAAWLRETLKRYSISAKHVAVAVSREDVVLRLLELPDVPDAEMPTLVRFQAVARSAQPIEQLLLDYLPLPHRPATPQKDVWLATTLLTTIDPIRLLLTEAGLELTELTISSLCLTELILRAVTQKSSDKSEASLVIYRSGPRMEVAVVGHGQLIAAHAVKWSAGELPPPAKMLSEVSRVLVPVQPWLPDGTLQRAWVIGEDADLGELPEAIRQRWNCPVDRCDPLKDCGLNLGNTRPMGHASDYAVAAGLASIMSGSISPKLDLLHPRQPPPVVDPNKPYYVTAAAAALLIFSLGTIFVQQTLANYDRQIEKLRAEELKQTRLLKETEPSSLAANTVADWQSRNINQLDQLSELYKVMNGTQRLVVGEYRFASQGVGNVLAKLKIAGNARDRNDIAELTQNLANLKKFSIKPSSLTTLSRDPDYVSRFDFEMDLVPVSSKPTTPKPGPGTAPPATPAKSPSTAGGD